MMSFSRVTNLRSVIESTSILRACTTSKCFIKNIPLKYFKTVAFSPTKCTKQIPQNCNKVNLYSQISSIPLTRTYSQLLHTRPLQSDFGRFLLFHGKSIKCTVHLFHTQRTCTAKLGSGLKGSSNKDQTTLIYIVAVFILMLGGAYAGVPLYKVFCQATGLGGQAVNKGHDTDKIESMKKVDRQIRVRFNADVASSMRWNFKPQQTEVTVLPGETALAFYTAKNPTEKAIIGISTYNVLPYDAGQYFNKIQCFCFEEQRLNPKEQVDMPVFFFIDPEFAEDPKLENVDTITLSYTFFEAVDGLTLPLPGYPQPHDPLPTAS